MTTLDEVVLQLVEEIQNTSTVRRVSGDNLRKLSRSVKKLVSDSLSVHGEKPSSFGFASLHKNRNRYSSSRYSRRLSYRIHVERAYNGLTRLGYIREVKRGYFDGFGGYLTRYSATEKLRQLFADIDLRLLPVFMVSDAPDEVIQVRKVTKEVDKNTGRKKRKSVLVQYTDIPKTHQMRRNVDKINKKLINVWIDLEISEIEWESVKWQLEQDTDKEVNPPNLANKTVYRVFSDKSFQRGGRFYGGWWQIIHKKLRSRILINGKRTVEFDYSGLHPMILYAKKRHLFPDDPYDFGLGEEHRDTVKKLFNAMLNASNDLRSPPKGIPVKETGLVWKEIKQLIKKKHSGISDYFGTGVGLELQYIDSCIAEELMLRFIDEKSGTALLPVHDSFIVHHGYADELKDMMLEIFERDFGNPIEVEQKKKQVIGVLDDVSLISIPKDVDTVLSLNDVGYEMRLGAHRKFILSQG
ncbi:hypothetical protein OAQ35_00940 [Litorivicinus sp.]|nr:hypothetical protein [Litorivicinus sp.]